MTSSLAEHLKLKIENEILMFNLKPGDRLDECRLADRYGSSRTPVREALRLLAAEGLVRIRPHRSAVVAGLSIAELMDLFEMMAIYEGACARLAASHATPEEIAEMERANEACRQNSEADDVESYCLTNAQFHEAIYNASHNRHLIKQTVSTRNRLGAYRRIHLRHNYPLKELVGEHESVLQAIKKGDAEEADRLMRKHIATQGVQLASLVTNLPPEYFADTSRNHSTSVLSRQEGAAYPAVALAFE